jgi:NAD-dependent SIR2 family protein deacetylase
MRIVTYNPEDVEIILDGAALDTTLEISGFFEDSSCSSCQRPLPGSKPYRVGDLSFIVCKDCRERLADILRPIIGKAYLKSGGHLNIVGPLPRDPSI